jgi:hypothetical protein
MTRRLITVGAGIGTALVLAVSSAWGASDSGRDAGDANGARLELTTPVQVVRDAGDAVTARLMLNSRHLPQITFIRDAGDATAARSRLRGSSEQSPVPVVRDAGDATAAKIKLQSGSRIR